MSLNKNIIRNLYESASIEVDDLAQELFDKYYDEKTNKFTKDLSQEIAQACENNQELIFKTKKKLEDMIKEQSKNKEEVNLSPELKETGDKICKILSTFGIEATLVNAKVGPRVTQYEFELAPGTTVSSVENKHKEIAMGLAVKNVSIGLVSGSSYIGIQVPNEADTNVSFDDVIKDSDKSGVSMALGKDTNGNTVSADILKLQHILIGGTTGSGKSACINTMICSLIESYSPDQVKLILIDPKKVELSSYANIPHLLMPIVTDPEKAAEVLDEMVKVMDKRYSDFEKVKVKNIESYNNLVEKFIAAGHEAKPMPYVIIIIDELADLMLTAKDSVETSIQRLTQLARAAGIHLIVATQRPSVDVVTGVIKSNINSRIAFTTSSGVDSRTILDTQGAEKLLGKGDMLYKPIGSSNATRVQGAFVSDDEIDNIVRDVNKKYGTREEAQTKSDEAKEEPKEEKDENYEKAIEFAKKNRRISAADLQLALHIPYSEASRIIQKMEENGLIKGQKGNKPRKVDRKNIKEV